MPRLFTGLEIPPGVAQSLATLRGGLPGARWVDPENYHVTLRFIGNVDDITAHEVASLLGRVHRQPFELRVEDIKSFGGRKPRAVVATLGPAQALMELQAEQERLMQRVGLEPDGRKYMPHVTLARLRELSSRQVADYLALRAPVRSAPFGSHASCCSPSRIRSAADHTSSRPYPSAYANVRWAVRRIRGRRTDDPPKPTINLVALGSNCRACRPPIRCLARPTVIRPASALAHRTSQLRSRAHRR